MGQTYLSKPVTTKETESGSFGSVEYAMSCMQGWRQSMEDAHICYPKFDVDTQLYAVFDGHGGFEVAIFVAKHFGRELKENAAYKSKDFTTALKETFLRMDELLLTEEGREDLLKIVKTRSPDQTQVQNTAGCTANVTLLYKNQIYVANSGDSRCVLSVDGKNLDLSKDHKPDDELELERIKKAGGSVTNGRVNGNLNLSRALGDLIYKSNKDLKPEEQLISPMPDVVIHEITPKDEFLLIGCDGIWELKTNQELVTICRKGLVDHIPLTKIVEDLLDQIIAKDSTQGLGCDNMSVILVKIKRNIVAPDAEPEKDSILANGVLDKYKAAGQISDLVVEEIIKKVKVNAVISELCQFGDELVEAEVKKVFTKDKYKGVAYPTSITLNELVSNYSPLKNTTDDKKWLVIKKGDLVKISVGVQIDGFVAESAQTVVCSEGASVDGAKADVIHAAYYSLQTALRTLNPENINTDTVDMIKKTSNIYKCNPISDVKSYEIKHNTMASKFFIPSLDDISNKNEFFTYRFEQYEVYTLNVLVSNGSGNITHIEGLPQSNIYQAHPEKHLKQVGIKKNAQQIYDNIIEHHSHFYFSARQFAEDPNYDKVLQEFKKQGVISQLPIESEESGKYVAQFKITVAIHQGGLILLSGLKLENSLDNLKSAYSAESDAEIKALLEKDVLKKKKSKPKKK
ncbi:hypothetical protein ABPG72_017399 [Tetrahymena utriculariae]